MIIDDHTYDLILIGTGAGGGTLAGALAESGKSVLVLERGGAMALTDQNLADVDLIRNTRYHPGEQWFGTDGDPFPPQMIYALGGNTKIWGGVLERFRERDFAPQRHLDGSCAGWELSYADLAPTTTAPNGSIGCTGARASTPPSRRARGVSASTPAA